MGSDARTSSRRCTPGHFNPRSPCGERLCGDGRQSGVQTEFQSTLPVWGATTFPFHIVHSDIFQSTLPVWGATAYYDAAEVRRHISIHAPRVGSDASPMKVNHIRQKFQSTLPVWGATPFSGVLTSGGFISIHAPRVGSDRASDALCGSPLIFQSTLPVWGATKKQLN